MRRYKEKQFVEEDSENFNDNSDDDTPDKIHDQFLENIIEFHGKPKINPASRNECAVKVSEFSFESKKKTDAVKSIFRENELLRAIKKKQPKVALKLQAVEKVKTLPKSLESIHEKKIQREVGFQNLKNHLNKWKDIIQTNRIADQISFPLKSKKVEIYDHVHNDLLSTFSVPTSLEKELSKVLNSSHIAKEDKKKVEQGKFRHTLKDMIEKRKILAKVKAKTSYKIAKAHRQNKIKSKKYHRILRNEKVKQQLQDFEKLKETDPETALKQLESLEKARARERATLRHKNTGKWAQNQIIKAKYNKESRIALSEQLSKNRELTEKLDLEKNSDTDNESVGVDAEMKARNIVSDLDNPWLDDTDEYAQFVSSYKKFWEEKINENSSAITDNKISKSKIVKEACNANANSSKNVVTVGQDMLMLKPEEIMQSKKRRGYNVAKKYEKDHICRANKCNPVKKIVNGSGSWTVISLHALCTDDGSSTTHKYEIKKVANQKKKNKKTKGMQMQNNNNIKNGLKTNELADSTELVPDVTENQNESIHLGVLKANIIIDEDCDGESTVKDLATEIPDSFSSYGDEAVDDNENYFDTRMIMDAVFTSDNVIKEFQKEKTKAADDSESQIVDVDLPGWGFWTGTSTSKGNHPQKLKRRKLNKRFLFRIPKVPPRKDSNRGHVIISEEKNNEFKEHLVSELPYPFTHVKDYEASIRAPVGRMWLSEIAHQQLIASPVVTKLGAVIEPMDEGELREREGS